MTAQAPIQFDRASGALEGANLWERRTVRERSILDRIKASSHVDYNVFGTASAFWQNRINAFIANAARRMQ